MAVYKLKRKLPDGSTETIELVPIASTTTPGVVKPDANDFSIDAAGNLKLKDNGGGADFTPEQIAALKLILQHITVVNGVVHSDVEIEAPSFNDVP